MRTYKGVVLLPKDFDKFWSLVEIRDFEDCWYWKGKSISQKGTGYGRIRIHNHVFHSNQLSYIWLNNTIPDGNIVLHSDVCMTNALNNFNDGRKSRLCCNPYHLRAGTYKENVQDTKRQGRMKGTFPKGIHVYFGENHGQHTLTTAQVESIKSDNRTHREIAKTYGINPATVSRIKSGQRRKDG